MPEIQGAYSVDIVGPDGSVQTIDEDDVEETDVVRGHTALSDWAATIPSSPLGVRDVLTSTYEAQVYFRDRPIFRGYLEKAESDTLQNQTVIEGRGIGRDLQDIDVEYHALDVDAQQAIRDVWDLTPFRGAATVQDPAGDPVHIDDRKFEDDALTVLQELHDIAGYRFSIDQVARNDQALDFDRSSNDYVQVPDSDAISVTGNITLAAWIRPEAVSSGSRNILAKDENAAYRWRITVGGDLWFLADDGDTQEVFQSNVSVDDDVVVHHAVRADFDDQTVTWFVDGEVADTAEITDATGFADTSGDLLIGAYRSDSETWNGDLSDVRIYNRALTDDQIQALYAGVNVQRGLKGYWPLRAGEGATAFDLARWNDGDIQGPDWVDSPVPTDRQQFSATVDSFEPGTIERDVQFIVRNRNPNRDLYDYANRVVVFGARDDQGDRPMAEAVSSQEIEALGGDPDDWDPSDPAVRTKVRRRPALETLGEVETEARSLLGDAVGEREDTGSVEIQPVNVPPGYDYAIDWYGTGNAIPTQNETVEFSEAYQEATGEMTFDRKRGVEAEVVQTKYTAQTIGNAI